MDKKKSNGIFEWDSFSDQPAIIKNKAAKRCLYIKGAAGSVKTLLTTLLLPFLSVALLFNKRTINSANINNIGLCINIDEPLDGKATVNTVQLQRLVADLNANNLLIRLPLANIEQLPLYIDFIKSFGDKKLLINILQDRKHIEDPELLHNSLRSIFNALSNVCPSYQIGNAVNRRKWAFISLDEYFKFFRVAQMLRDTEFPQLQLTGANIIDFELPNFSRALFHCHPIHYDATAALLYVDRRGAPENTQMGYDLLGKINWFYSLVRISPKTQNKLVITETNWPLENTEPYAPAVGACMISEELQATYLVRYYLLMFASGKISMCYWHQLIAPGYGLIDNRGNNLRKRKAYYAFKLLIQIFENASVTAFYENKRTNLYRLSVNNSQGSIKAIWANDNKLTYKLSENETAIDLIGNPITISHDGILNIDDDVSYIINKNPAT